MRQPVPIPFIRMHEIVSIGNVLRAYAVRRPLSRRTKPISSKFYRLPAAENHFSEIFFHFPPREGVSRSSRSVSRFILAFRKSITPSRESDVRIAPAERFCESYAMAKTLLEIFAPPVQAFPKTRWPLQRAIKDILYGLKTSFLRRTHVNRRTTGGPKRK